MTRRKIAITQPEEPAVAARQAAARRDADEELAESIAEIYAEMGSPTAGERDWARQTLGIDS